MEGMEGGGGARCNMNGFKFNLSTYLIYQTALVGIHQYIVYTQKYCIALNLRYASVLINPTTDYFDFFLLFFFLFLRTFLLLNNAYYINAMQ